MESATGMELGDIEFPPGVKDLSSDMNPAEMVKALKVHNNVLVDTFIVLAYLRFLCAYSS